jgi:hypothetical protein
MKAAAGFRAKTGRAIAVVLSEERELVWRGEVSLGLAVAAHSEEELSPTLASLKSMLTNLGRTAGPPTNASRSARRGWPYRSRSARSAPRSAYQSGGSPDRHPRHRTPTTAAVGGNRK